MQDKKLQSQGQSQQSAAQNKCLNKFSYSHFDLCFTYSNPKHKSRKQLSPILAQPATAQRTDPKFRLSCRLAYKKQLAETTSSPFFRKSMQKPVQQQTTKQTTEGDQMPYIGWGFPQRKRKSGDQQFLKLLLKYSDNLMVAGHFRRQNREGQLELNPEKEETARPKLKVRTKLNWVKDRYCVNRDRQGGLFKVPRQCHQDTTFRSSCLKMQRNEDDQITTSGSWLLFQTTQNTDIQIIFMNKGQQIQQIELEITRILNCPAHRQPQQLTLEFSSTRTNSPIFCKTAAVRADHACYHLSCCFKITYDPQETQLIASLFGEGEERMVFVIDLERVRERRILFVREEAGARLMQVAASGPPVSDMGKLGIAGSRSLQADSFIWEKQKLIDCYRTRNRKVNKEKAAFCEGVYCLLQEARQLRRQNRKQCEEWESNRSQQSKSELSSKKRPSYLFGYHQLSLKDLKIVANSNQDIDSVSRAWRRLAVSRPAQQGSSL